MTSPATQAGSLRVRIVTDATGVRRDVEREVQGAADAATRGTERAGRDIGERARSAGTKASIGLSLPLLALGKAALDVASDTVEATNKVGVVFGEGAKTVEAFAAGAAKSIGISKREALAAAGGFGALFTTMGIGQTEAAGLSTKLVTLGADMASFSNSSPEEALQALKSGLNGESEPLRRFGVFLSDARVQAEALASGLVKPVANAAKVKDAALGLQLASAAMANAVKKYGADSTQAMTAQRALTKATDAYSVAAKGTVPDLTEAQKAQARYNVIMKDTGQAQGDVQRSAATSAAVQASFAKAARDDAAGALGESLIPLSITASKTLTGLANSFGGLSSEQQKGVLIAGASLAALGPLLTVGGNLLRVSKAVTVAVRSETAARAAARAGTIAGTIVGRLYVAVLYAQRAAMVAANVASRVLAIGLRLVGVAVRFAMGPVGIAIAVVALLAAGIVLAYKRSETFRNIVQGIGPAIGRVFGAMGNAVQATLGLLKRGLDLALVPVRLYLSVWQAVARGVIAVVQGAWSFVGGIFGRIKGAVEGLVGTVKGVINTVIGALKRLRIPGFSVGVGPISYRFGGLDPFAGIPFLAAGGIVPATPGGRLAVVGEGRSDEAVLPLDGSLAKRLGLDRGRGDVHLTIVVQNPAREPASESVNKRLRRLAALGVVDAAAGGARELVSA